MRKQDFSLPLTKSFIAAFMSNQKLIAQSSSDIQDYEIQLSEAQPLYFYKDGKIAFFSVIS